MSKMTPKITVEKSKGQDIETPITSERSKVFTFCKKRWHHNIDTICLILMKGAEGSWNIFSLLNIYDLNIA